MLEELAAAYAVIKNDNAPLAKKLMAHERILRFGAPGCGEIARQERIAEATGDLCLAVATIMTALSKP